MKIYAKVKGGVGYFSVTFFLSRQLDKGGKQIFWQLILSRPTGIFPHFQGVALHLIPPGSNFEMTSAPVTKIHCYKPDENMHYALQ